MELHHLRPDWRLIVSSAVEPRFLKLALLGIPVELRCCQWDVGVIQDDALGVDLDSTLVELKKLDMSLPELIDKESDWLCSQQEQILIIADIPPSASLLASKLGVSVIWMGNFGWDEIYKPFGSQFTRYSEAAFTAYKRGNILLRYPFSLAMNWGLPEIKLALTASRPRPLPEDFQNQLDSDLRPLVFIGFGGLGLSIDSELFSCWPEHLFLMYPPTSRQAFLALDKLSNVLFIPPSVRSIDVMPFCSRLLGKPGFSTFCEALSQNLGLIVVERKDFAEVRSLMDGLRQHGSHRTLTRIAFDQGQWDLDLALIEPSRGPLNCDGANLAAEAIVQSVMG